MTAGEIILALVGFAITLLGTIAVFRRGAGDSIDRKRESEIVRLDRRVDEIAQELHSVTRDAHLVASLAVRAIRAIEKIGTVNFTMKSDEREALERTRPVGGYVDSGS